MRRVYFLLLALLVATAIHVDWHFARPAHHRLSLDWSSHWLFAVPIGALVGLLVARGFALAPYRAAAAILLLGIVIGHGVEPLLEAVLYHQRIGYSVDAQRWAAFLSFTAVASASVFLTIGMVRKRVLRFDG